MNLQYEVLDKKKSSVKQEVVERIKDNFKGMAGILYCLSRKECDDISEFFNKQGIRAKAYHAGMSDKMRNAVQAEWLCNRVQVMSSSFLFSWNYHLFNYGVHHF